MTKTITRIGNSQGIIFDAAELTHLKPGDAVNIEFHDGGVITVTPIGPVPSGQQESRVTKRPRRVTRRR